MQKRGKKEDIKFDLEKKHRAQAAMEFMVTYGWAIMVVLVVIGALSYFGVLSPDKFIPRRCALEPGIACMDSKVDEGTVTLVLRNGMGEDITISSIKISSCAGTASGVLNNGEENTLVVGGCSNTINKKFIGGINITYTGETGLTHKNRGNIVERVEAGSSMPVPVQKTLHFREDGSFVNTTYDAQISSNNPNTNYGSATSINVDGQSPHAHAVIKFPNIFGSGNGQIPSGAQIDSATLTVECFGNGNIMNSYLLKEDWDESEVTWNERTDDLSWSDPGADGTASRYSAAEAWDCQSTGTKNFDMTNFVQSWSDGTSNYGVVVIDTGNNGVDFYSSEHTTITNRPLLEVTYTS